MALNLPALTSQVVEIIRSTDLTPLPADGSEDFGTAMRHVMLYLDGRVKQLQVDLHEAADMTEYVKDRTRIYNHCKEAAEAEKGG